MDEVVLNQLRERAARHGRSSSEEAKSILAEALRGTGRDDWASVDAIYQRLAASRRPFSDSALHITAVEPLGGKKNGTSK